MNLYEYQTRELFETHGVPTSAGIVASAPQEAESAARELGGGLVVVKAQVKTGGRGKTGGAKLARSPQEAADRVEEILGMDTKGHKVRRVLVASGANIARKFYFSVLLDRSERRYLTMCSVNGGMDIETLVKERPEALAKVAVDPNAGIDEAEVREIASAAGFDAETGEKAVPALLRLWDVYSGEDATLIEVNPLALTERGGIVVLDGKVALGDNVRFHHNGHETLVDKAVEDPLKAEAEALGLNYIKLDGQVGVIGSDAGLVMSTLDVVACAGEEYGTGPANFLDIGGGADANVMSNGLAVILRDPDARSVLVNIFDGITICDEVVKGIVAAPDVLGEAASKPIVVCLDGNVVAEDRAILAQVNHPPVALVDTVDGAAAKVAQLAAGSDTK